MEKKYQFNTLPFPYGGDGGGYCLYLAIVSIIFTLPDQKFTFKYFHYSFQGRADMLR